jgi:hypothetical protein
MKSNRGSVLLMTLILVTSLAIIAYSIYDLALGAYRLSLRNEYRARAKVLADSELDYAFFRLENAMMSGTEAKNVPWALHDICHVSGDSQTASQLGSQQGGNTVNLALVTPDPRDHPFVVTLLPAETVVESTLTGDRSVIYGNTPDTGNWQIKRSITYDSTAQAGGSIYNYFTVEVEVTSGPGCPIYTNLHLGRHMNNSVTSIFGKNIFAQGDLDFSPDGNTIINGDIAANGNITMGAHAVKGSTLTINAGVYYLQGDQLNTTGPIVEAGQTINIDPPTWGSPGKQQVFTMDKAMNLLGGLNASDIAQKYGSGVGATNLFGAIPDGATSTDPALLAAENLVYRSVIAPPPTAVAATAGQYGNGASYQSEYPGATNLSALQAMVDDPGIGALRSYNRAGLIVTVNGDNSYTITAGPPNGKNDITSSINTAAGGQIVTTKTPDASGTLVPLQMYDLREANNVAIAQIDVGLLNTALTNPTIAAQLPNGVFNGVLYVYLAGSSSTTPAAARLVNGAQTPNNGAAGTASATGFTVATNGGLYVKGDYNTVTSNGALLVDTTTGQETPGHGAINPAALMADAITVLSPHWDDTVVAADTNPMDTADSRVAAPAGTIVTPGIKMTGFTQTIAAGILTGDTKMDSSGNAVYSGGGDNLVRFLEDWNYCYTPNIVNFYGSFGRLFGSQDFTGQWWSPSGDPSDPHSYIYNYPSQRVYSFDSQLKESPPPCTPNTTAYSRGDVFTW